MRNVYVGTSGYNYKDWKNKLYPKTLPQKDWLKFFATQFETVEINATFYRSFPQSVFLKWHDATPSDFKFTIKGSRFITHIKRIKSVDEELGSFFESVEPLNKKLSIVLWQFPASFVRKNEIEKNLAGFLSSLPKNIKQVVELRHKSWFEKDIFDLLTRNNVGFVINDSSRFESVQAVTGNLTYIRFHGPGRLYASSYSSKELKVWAEKIKKYRLRYDVYCYFNNDVSGFAIDNAKELRELVGQV